MIFQMSDSDRTLFPLRSIPLNTVQPTMVTSICLFNFKIVWTVSLNIGQKCDFDENLLNSTENLKGLSCVHNRMQVGIYIFCLTMLVEVTVTLGCPNSGPNWSNIKISL